MDMVTDGGSKAGKAARQKKIEDGGINAEKLSQVQQESCKCALEMNHGLMVEALKNFMFTSPAPAL